MMDCFHTMAPADDDLLKFVLDEVSLPKTAREHIKHCTICQQRLTHYKTMNSYLLSHLYRSECPTSMQISLYAASYLPEQESLLVAAHIRRCPLCAREVADTRHSLANTRLMTTAPLPLHKIVQYITAIPITAETQLVLRNGTTKVKWPRQYRAETINLLLDLTPTGHQKYIVLGAISDLQPGSSIDAFEGVEIELHIAQQNLDDKSAESQSSFMATQVDDLGSFVFNAVPIGTYCLIAHLPGRDVVVEELTIDITASE
jgi:hypothetical protein